MLIFGIFNIFVHDLKVYPINNHYSFLMKYFVEKFQDVLLLNVKVALKFKHS
jgi:hypothetical protein